MAPLDVEQYRALIELLPALVWRTDSAGGCDYVSDSWTTFTGRSAQQELGEGWRERIHPQDVERFSAGLLECFERRARFEAEVRLRRFDGVFRAMQMRAAPYTSDGRFGGFIGSCADLEDHRAGEVSPGDGDFFEMSLDNLCVAGFDGYLKRVNPSWTRTLGWTEQELLSKPSLHFVHPADREATLAARGLLLVGSDLAPLVNRYLCKDGSYRWFEWRSVGHPERGVVYAAARDITEQKLAEARLVEAKEVQEKLHRQLLFADRMASVGTLAAGVAHEINNPLAYVTGNIAMIIEDLGSLGAESASGKVAEVKEMALEAQMGAERIRKIVLGLKTFSRADEERLAAIELEPILELAIDMAFHEIRHRATLLREYGKTPLVDADDARLGQVFINLLVNAAQALPAAAGANNEIRIVTQTDTAGRAVVEICDTGSGIPASMIDRIFDPFFTTKPVGIGTGLGLSICRNIVLGMGGEITVSSVEGRGTTFRLVFPAASTQPVEAGISRQQPRSAASTAAVLVVDDEPAIGVVLRRVLREHQVTVVTRAKHALELLGSGQHFDVILSDLMMPEMTGMTFYDELAEFFPQLLPRVAFITGGAFSQATQAFLDRAPNEVIPKPIEPQQVRDTVQRLLASKAT